MKLNKSVKTVRRFRVGVPHLAAAIFVTSLAGLLPARSASADYVPAATGSVTSKLCWSRFDGGFGSGYTIKVKIVNNTPNTHTGSVIVGGVTTNIAALPRSTSATVAVPVSIDLGHTFTYKVDGAATGWNNIPAANLRNAYIYNCETQLTGNGAIDNATVFATSHVGDNYVGAGSKYRKGQAHTDTISTTGGGQKWYKSVGNTIGFDCSGLVAAAYPSLAVPGSSLAMLTWAGHPRQALSAKRPGDLLVLYRANANGTLSSGHVGVYLGHGEDATTDYVVEATPWQTLSGDGLTQATAKVANGVKITPYSDFIGRAPSGFTYVVVRPVN
jgi:cell wall-associated NlpC family hydrolase